MLNTAISVNPTVPTAWAAQGWRIRFSVDRSQEITSFQRGLRLSVRTQGFMLLAHRPTLRQ